MKHRNSQLTKNDDETKPEKNCYTACREESRVSSTTNYSTMVLYNILKRIKRCKIQHCSTTQEDTDSFAVDLLLISTFSFL
mmetsp:Transcript_24632/g.51126  ORF Transcript_24632/g.51126 Transcript_24632/m.51126 type:complete len:81 (-) Transcript_24632:2051-2293(-)